MLSLCETKIAVEPLFEPNKIGHIYVPDQAKARANQGIVKYVGSGVKTVKIGDHILFGGYVGTTIHLEGEGVLIIVEEEFIQAIIHDEVKAIPGLYCKGKYGDYFPATHEIAIKLIRDCIGGIK